MKTVNIGIIGLGTVGSGVVRLLQRHRDRYLSWYGVDLRLARACARSASHAEELGLAPGVFTTDWRDVVSDPEVDVVVELIGGDHPATEIFEEAFRNGKHVVTANKSMLSHDMGRMAGLAHDAGVQLKCEAAAAGGIPIVEALERSFAGNEVLTIAGIVNGTTNYMLTRMEREGMSFEDVLADAQRLGYAEAEPSADVDGWDAAAKMAILATIGFNTRVTLADVATVEGIRSVTTADIEFARRLGYRVKLLGVARKTGDGLDVRVHPAMIPVDHQLASVDGVFNAVYVVGDAVGETMFYGAGAGSFPTASAVMGDILAVATPIAHGEVPSTEAAPFERVLPMRPIAELRDRYYVRLSLCDRPGVLGQVASVFASCGVSLASVTQPAPEPGEDPTLIVVTHLAREADVRRACEEIEASDAVIGAPCVIRVEDTEAWRREAL